MKTAYVIGRFQPYHRGHNALVSRAVEIADVVVVIIGCTGCKPDYKNPWTFEERANWIRKAWTPILREGQTLRILPVEDVPYDDPAWVVAVRLAVLDKHVDPSECYLVGHKKDASSFYLDLFPDWQFVEVAPQLTTGATTIRERFFLYQDFDRVREMLDRHVFESMQSMGVSRFLEVRQEALAVEQHDKDWNSLAGERWGVQHVTVDVVLETRDSVLVIERGGDIGKGALAMPGGFVNKDERVTEAALRELQEETGIVLPRDWFPANGIGSTVMFDHPGRSLNGRIFTNVLHHKWKSDNIPMPKASDDARRAFWMLKTDLPKFKHLFFADHYHIINHFIEG